MLFGEKTCRGERVDQKSFVYRIPCIGLQKINRLGKMQETKDKTTMLDLYRVCENKVVEKIEFFGSWINVPIAKF